MAPPAALPTLTTARAAHRLPISESARGYPVHLRGVVTYYDPFIDPRRPAYFVSDSTGGIFVALSSIVSAPPKAGDLVEITGVTGPGDFAPIVDHASTRVLAASTLPAAAPRVSLTHLLTGAEDGQWVEVEGIVRSVGGYGQNVVLFLALGDGDVTATTIREPGADYSRLVDARVTLRGNAGPLFNHHRQMTGVHLLFPGLSVVRVQDPAPPHPFDSPLVPVGTLLRYSPDVAFRRRLHVRGQVTLFWPGRVVCIQEGDRGLCARTEQTSPIAPGDVADVVGFPQTGEFAPGMSNAIYATAARTAGAPHRVPQPPVPLAITAEQAITGDHDAELVRMEGYFIGEDRAASDPAIVLSSGKFIFSASLPARSRDSLPLLREGSRVRISGICSAESDVGVASLREGFSVPRSFRIMLRSQGDIVLLEAPSWWNAEHTLRVLAGALFVLLLGAFTLWRQVRRVRRTAGELRREMGERQRAEDATRYALDRMEYQAHHDPLTGLANRLMFNRRMQECLVRAEKQGTRVGLLFLDLDRFKAINDSLGHAAGDLLLQQAAQRLTDVAPPGSLLARLGGDEFAFLLPGTAEKTDAEAVAARVIEVLANPFEIEGSPWYCPASVGLSVFPEDAQCATLLQRNADTALYRAKQTAPGTVVTFDRLMRDRAERSVLVEKAVRRAVDRDGFTLVYQPQFRSRGGLRGFEALLRLDDPALGAVSPAEFIPIAEETGLICVIGAWVLREACGQWARWEAKGCPSISMAVNVSAVQLSRGDLPSAVRDVLEEMGMPPALLELELTETGIFADAKDVLLELKETGVHLAVDDFGTGFSSLGSLRQAPVDCVKIDRSFVRDAACTPGTLPFIRTIVELARSLGMTTVAEGVETQGQKDAVKAAGCDVLQGYLLSHPLSAADAGRLLEASEFDGYRPKHEEELVGSNA